MPALIPRRELEALESDQSGGHAGESHGRKTETSAY